MLQPQTPWQKYIEPNYDYIEMLYSDPNFKESLLKFWQELLESFTFTLINTSEKEQKVNLDVLRGKILAYQELVQLFDLVKKHKILFKQHQPEQNTKEYGV